MSAMTHLAPGVGLTTEFCRDCGKETVHKMVEICGKIRKFCKICDERDFVNEQTRD